MIIKKETAERLIATGKAFIVNIVQHGYVRYAVINRMDLHRTDFYEIKEVEAC